MRCELRRDSLGTERVVKVAALCAVLLLAPGCARSDAPKANERRGKLSPEVVDAGPRLVGNPPTVQIELPQRMTATLAAADSGFVTLGPFDFVKDVASGSRSDGAWRYSYDGHQAPFALIADFDGDRHDDVALLQRSPEAGRVVVLFDRSDGVRAEIVKAWNRASADDLGKSAFYLTISNRLISSTGERLITLGNYGKTATTYSWSDLGFESVPLGD